jgi:hypothetical protein
MVAANLNAQINILKMTEKMFSISFGVIMIQKRMLSMAKTLRENKKVEHVQKTLNLGEHFHMGTIFLKVTKGYVFVKKCSFLHLDISGRRIQWFFLEKKSEL